MIIRGIVIPLGKINRAEHKWGIKSSTTEINRLLKSMHGKPLKMCKECVVNPKDAHACDDDPNATVGKIKRGYYDREKNAIGAVVEVTNTMIENDIRSGKIKRAWSPGVIAAEQDETGFLSGNEFENITLVGRPAFEDATFDIVAVGEAAADDDDDDTSGDGDDDTSGDDDDEEPKDDGKKKGKLDVNKKKADNDTVTIKKDDLLKLIDEKVAEAMKEKKPPAPPKDDEGDTDDNDKPNGQFLTREQMDAIFAEKKLEGQKEVAIQQYEDAAEAAGIDVDEDDLNAIKSLPLEQIKKLTKNYVNMASKIPEKPKRNNKPTYYNKETGTGGIDGSSGLTVGFPDDDGNWHDK